MHLILGKVRGNSAETERLYAESCPAVGHLVVIFEHQVCMRTFVFVAYFLIKYIN
jgi:hypothetical protein